MDRDREKNIERWTGIEREIEREMDRDREKNIERWTEIEREIERDGQR